MNIIYFIDHLRPDGAQFVLRQLVEGLSERGHQQTVICLNDSWDENLVDAMKNCSAKVEIIGKPALLSGYGFYKIWRCLKRDQFDVAVTILFASDVIGKIMSWMAGLPKIISNVQTRDEFYSFFQRWLVRKTMPLTDLVILPSHNIDEFVVSEEGASPDKIIVVNNFVQFEKYQNPVSREEFFSELGLSLEMNLIGCAGRLTHQKGYDVLLQALSLMKRDDFHVFIAGVGEDEVKLKSMAFELGLNHKINWAGYRRDLSRILGVFDVFVQPSRYEGMPLAVLEAMASGCPVILSSVDGNRELVENGVSGWLVPPEDPGSLAYAMEFAIENKDERGRRAVRAKQRVSDQFNSTTIINEWEKVLANHND